MRGGPCSSSFSEERTVASVKVASYREAPEADGYRVHLLIAAFLDLLFLKNSI